MAKKTKIKKPIMTLYEERFMAFEGVLQWTQAVITQSERVAAALSQQRVDLRSHDPVTRCWALLQQRLANLLYDCLDELKKATPARRSLAHGFERKRNIITNASLHKRRRYVLNLDLEDFFPSINFGRVRGFFLKDKHFAVQPTVATIIAQIAYHENELPEASPCSP
jgi:hypothetical protein